MDKLLGKLRSDYPHLTFVAGTIFCWSPAGRHVVYKLDAEGPTAVFSLLHEVGHALLQHKRYKHDFELLALEAAAWEEAKRVAKSYEVIISEDHIQDCLDSYRDWLYRRSICPSCTAKSLQLDGKPVYKCFNCGASWQVAASRFCRPYRQGGRNPSTPQTKTITFA